MIKINLLGDEIQRDSSAVLWLAAMAVSFIAFFMLSTFLYFDVSNQLTIRQQEVSDLERQLAQLKTKTKEVSGLEKKQKELNGKLAVIAELKLSKQGPVRVLNDLNQAVPERAWLRGISEKGSSLSITGLALDGQTVAGFMDQLEDSNYFADVSVETRSTTREKVKIQSFTLLSKLSYAGNLRRPKDDLAQTEEDSEKKEG
ncbi:PilN domain-containing protein [bacterium]|nr:PilN domain-containing protein [bacterium]